MSKINIELSMERSKREEKEIKKNIERDSVNRGIGEYGSNEEKPSLFKDSYVSHYSKSKSRDSICLVYKEENKSKNLILNQDALDIIQNLKGDISVCSVIGQYRSGKSFLLSNLFKKLTNTNQCPFQVGHEEDGFTKGCLISKQIPKIKNKHSNNINVLLIDTEGLESEENDEQWDTKLFLFNLLISSMFIYNTKSNLNSDDFKKLAVMSNLSDKVKLHSKSSRAENEKKLRQEGPHFVCIVRDFHLNKDKYSSKESIERFLDFEEEEEDDVAEKAKNNEKIETAATRNEIRKNMQNSFKEFDCFRLSRPVSDDTIENKDMEEALQMLDKIDYEKLRLKFREEFDEMSVWFQSNIQPKSIKNTNMDGRTLCEFMKLIVDAINTNQTIKLHDTLTSAIRAGIDRQFELIKTDYSNFISEIKLPIKSNELNQKNQTKCNELRNKFKIEVDSKLFDEYELRLNEHMTTKFKEIKDKNEKETESYNKSKSIEIWNRDYSTKVNRFETVNEFESLLNSFKNDFKCRYQFDTNSEINSNLWFDFESKINAKASRDALRNKENEKQRKEFEEKQKREAEERQKREAEERQRREAEARSYQAYNFPSSFYCTPSYLSFETPRNNVPRETRPAVHSRNDRQPDIRVERVPGFNKDGSLDMRFKKNW